MDDGGCRGLLLCALLAACSGDGREHLTVYSPHGREQLTLLEQRSRRPIPDIDVRWLDMGSQDILDRVRFEKPNPVADVWFGGPTPLFDRGVAEGVLSSRIGQAGGGASTRVAWVPTISIGRSTGRRR